MKKVAWQSLISTCLLFSASALAGSPARPTEAASPPRSVPCQGDDTDRSVWPNTSLLYGTARPAGSDQRSSVLVSVDLGRMRLEHGRLVPPPSTQGLKGTVIQGSDSDGNPVKVAICGAKDDPEDPEMAWYQIEVLHEKSGSWVNPCIATHRSPSPKALPMAGVWDKTGTSRKVAGKFTFACQNGALAKCVSWGYKPWAKRDGHSLQDMHQACTRMARADYCGDGYSHTRDDDPIDVSDNLGINTRAQGDGSIWTLEATWAPDGAACVARTRDGQAARAVLEKCPARFEEGEQRQAEGELCTVHRKGKGSTPPKLINRMRASLMGTP